MSHVLKTLQVLNEDMFTGGVISVTGDQIQYRGNDGSLFYIDFARPILDLLRGSGYSSSQVSIRSRGGYS
jgi:hypothetical protein